MFANLQDETKQEILGLLLVSLTVLTYLGLESKSGGLGEVLRLVLTAVFGRAAYVVPALVGVAGLACVFRKGHLLGGSRAVGWLLALAVGLGWLHRLEPRITGLEFENVRYGIGGGLVGAVVAWALRRLAGPIGRDVILATLSLVALLLATDVSLVTLGQGLWAALRAVGRFLGRAGGGLARLFRRPERPRRSEAVAGGEARGYGAHRPGAVVPPGIRPSVRSAAGGFRPGLGVNLSEGVSPARVGTGVTGRVGAGEEDDDLGAGPGERGYPGSGRPGAFAGGLGAPGLGPAAAGTAAGPAYSPAPGGLLPLGTTGPAQPGPAPAGTRPGGGRPVAGVGAPSAGAARKGYEQIALTEDLLYELPPLSLLEPTSPGKSKRSRQDLEEKAHRLEEVLATYGVTGKVIDFRRGPVVTRFDFQPAPGIKVARVASLVDDIAMNMAAESVRIEAPIPGKQAVGIELPNQEVSAVPLRDVLEDPEVASRPSKLIIGLGKDITGRSITGDLDRLLHILVAGATGSGKSVCINSIIASLLFRAKPSEVKFLLIDPKVVELSVYEGIPHLVAPVVTDPKKSAGCLRWAVRQMEERYELFAAAGVRDITRYNELVSQEREASAASSVSPPGSLAGQAARPGGPPTGSGPRPLPCIVIVIDELADLMMVAPIEVENLIFRLAQMGRAAGIHLIVATQRPTVDVITGTIKANIPTRIAFAVASQVDSRVIIDAPGAEKLLGRGDMLYLPVGSTKPTRVQGAYVSDREIEALVRFVRAQGKPRYSPDVLAADEAEEEEAEEADDDLFEDAVRVVMESGTASISMIQRKLRVGYTRAGRLIDMMEEKGIVGPFEGSKPRDILMTWDQYRRSREATRRLQGQRSAGERPSVAGEPTADGDRLAAVEARAGRPGPAGSPGPASRLAGPASGPSEGLGRTLGSRPYPRVTIGSSGGRLRAPETDEPEDE